MASSYTSFTTALAADQQSKAKRDPRHLYASSQSRNTVVYLPYTTALAAEPHSKAKRDGAKVQLCPVTHASGLSCNTVDQQCIGMASPYTCFTTALAADQQSKAIEAPHLYASSRSCNTVARNA